MIIDRETGLPLFQPTVWTLRQYRHRSAATIEQALRGAMLLHLFCRHRVIDLGQRLSTGTSSTFMRSTPSSHSPANRSARRGRSPR